MSSKDEILATLKLFNVKAYKQLQASFTQAYLDPKRGVKVSGEKKRDGSFEISTNISGPSQESVDAFVLTFRFFIQDNDQISFRNIAKIYDDELVAPEFKDRFNSARNAINSFLDSPNEFSIQFNTFKPTNREVMNVFIYGGLAHANPEKSETFSQWMSIPPVAGHFYTCFVAVLGEVLNAIEFIARLNDEVVSSLGETS